MGGRHFRMTYHSSPATRTSTVIHAIVRRSSKLASVMEAGKAAQINKNPDDKWGIDRPSLGLHVSESASPRRRQVPRGRVDRLHDIRGRWRLPRPACLDAIQEPLAALEVFARNAIGGETQKAKLRPNVERVWPNRLSTPARRGNENASARGHLQSCDCFSASTRKTDRVVPMATRIDSEIGRPIRKAIMCCSCPEVISTPSKH